MDAITLLKEDHNKVKQIFQRFEHSQDRREKKELGDQAIVELQVHSMLEEEIFYPAARSHGLDEKTMNEADEEHHVADMVMMELIKMNSADEHYEAKFKVLAENVKHHIQEEETMMLPKASAMGRDMLDQLGQRMMERKQQLMGEAGGRPMPMKRRRSRSTSASRGSTSSRSRGSTRGRSRTTARKR